MKVMKIAATAALALGVMTACTSNDSAAPATVTVTATPSSSSSSAPSQSTSPSPSRTTTTAPVEDEIDCQDSTLSMAEWTENCNSASIEGENGEVPEDAVPPGVTEASNPVTLAKKIPGCVLDEGSEVGTSFMGVRSTSCTIGDFTMVDVTTFPGSPLEVGPDFVGESDDSVMVVVGPDFVLTVIPENYGQFSPEEVESWLGGDYQEPNFS